ncbi:MAG: hypothetical protein E7564_06075 [Ruminococcaceae bacterium]|nr:hypothetical protein [Oscillospiraceae bacterium]
MNLLKNRNHDYENYKTPAEGLYWPEWQAIPSFAKIEGELDALNLEIYSNNVKIALTALQGQVNKVKPKIILFSSNALIEGTYTWPQRLGIKTNLIDSPFELIKKYQDAIKGVVLYAGRNPHYANLAASVANFSDAIPVDVRLYELMKEHGIELPVTEDLTSLKFRDHKDIYNYLYDNYFDKCSKRIFFSLSPMIHTSFVRDMAAAVGGAIVWLDARIEEEEVILHKFLKHLPSGHSIILGWWPEERSGIGAGTKHGVSTIPSDFYDNSTVYASFEHIMHIPAVPKKPKLENKIYLAIFLSDGDNVQYCQHRMSELWINEGRGSVPLNWTVSPGLVDIGPGLLNYFYDTASENDCFCSGPSGLGYALLFDEHNNVLNMSEKWHMDKYMQLSNRYFIKNGIRVVTAWDKLNGMHRYCYAHYARGLYGVTTEDWFQKPCEVPVYTERDRMAFIPNRPAYAEKIEDIVAMIKDKIMAFDGSKPMFFATQGVTWSLTPQNMKALVDILNEMQPGKVEILRGDHFFALYNEANGLAFNLALSPDAKATNKGEDASVILNGSPYGKNMWEAKEAGAQDFIIDLGRVYTINRYVIKNAGVNDEDKSRNNKAFTISCSLDGVNYELIDSRDSDTSNIIDCEFLDKEAKFIKLSVLEGGEDGIVRIGDVEIYGRI